MNQLGAILYDPAAAVSKATSSLLAMTAFDTSNLRLAITVPAHGRVRFRLSCNLVGATTTPTVLLGVMNGATVIGRVVPQYENATANASTQSFTMVAEFTVTGLTPGAMNCDAAYAVQVVVASTNIKYGGPNTNGGANAWGGFVFEAWDPTPIATTGQLFVDANGRVDIIKIAGTTQTARDLGTSVLLSSGTGTGQLDFTSGVVKANLAQILGTAITETAGQIAAAFKQFFDVASPTGTMKAITAVGTVTTVTNQLTAAQIATGVWQDATAGDFTAANSVGKSVMNGVALGTGLTVSAVSGAVGSVTGAVGSVTGNVGGNVTGSVGSVVAAPPDSSGVTTLLSRLSAARATKLDAISLRDGTAQAGAATTITLDASASATDSIYNDNWVVIESGTGIGQARLITGYVGSTKVATITPAWTTNPDATSVFAIVPATKLRGVTLADTVTTYTGNTPQTGDAFARLGAPAGASVSADVASIKTDTGTTIPARLPAALVGGRMDSSVGAMAANVLTATAINADAITAAKIADGSIDAATFAAGAINAAAIAADAITDAKVASDVTIASVTGAVGSVTGAVGSVTGAVGSVTGNVGGNVVGSVASVTAGVTVTTNNDKTGYTLSTAGILAIWHQLTSAIVTAGTIGKLILDYLDAAISSRSTYAGGDTSGTTTLLSRLTGTRATNLDNLDAAISTRSTYAGADTSGTTTLLSRLTGTRATNLDNVDAAISTRLASAGYTAPDNADIVLIKAKTDNLPSDPADASDVAGAFSTVNSTLSTIAGYIDTEVAAIKLKTDNIPASPAAASDCITAAGVRTAVGLASANLDTQLDALPTNAELTTALAGADDATLAAIAALNNLSQANVRTAIGLASANLDTQLDALPTNAELVTALATADDATLAAVTALNNLSSAQAQTAAAAALAAYDVAKVADVPTGDDNADALLKRDWTAITGEASRSVLNALRFIRNRFSTTTTPGSVDVFKEDDTTPAYSKSVTTNTNADPIVEG